MNALSLVAQVSRPQPILIPTELAALLDDHDGARRGFELLGDGDRRGMVDYVSEARLPAVRERRAALVVMSLATLPRA